MRLRLAYIMMAVVVFTSCKTVKKITNSPNGGTQIERQKSKKAKTFIDGIEVTPGSVVKSKHKPNTTKQVDSTAVENTATTNSYTSINASFLQNKYAEKIGINATSLTNENLLAKIDEWWGVRYCMGGSTKKCVDCSAFTQTLFAEVFGESIPRTAAEQHNYCSKIDKSELQIGDLVFFITYLRTVSHVGLYLGNDKFVHASTSQGVMISDLNDSYWKPRYYASGRVLK